MRRCLGSSFVQGGQTASKFSGDPDSVAIDFSFPVLIVFENRSAAIAPLSIRQCRFGTTTRAVRGIDSKIIEVEGTRQETSVCPYFRKAPSPVRQQRGEQAIFPRFTYGIEL